MIAAIIILVYTSIGLGVGATMFCVDKMLAPSTLSTSDMWMYLGAHMLLWPLTSGFNIYETVKDYKHISEAERNGIECRCYIHKGRNIL